jgi:hypothetical protein
MESSGGPAAPSRHVLNFASFSHFQAGTRARLRVALSVL